MRRLLLLAFTALLACHRSSAPTSKERLERAASDALTSGHPHLATLLVDKAAEFGDPSPQAWVTSARGAARSGALGSAHQALIAAVTAGLTDLSTVKAAPELALLRDDGGFAWVEQRVAQNRAHQAPRVGVGIDASTPEKEGIDPGALQTLLANAQKAHSSAVVLLRHGKLVGQRYFGEEPKTRRIEAMSATKSVVSLAAMLLLADGKLRSLEQPVADFFPEWRSTPKAAITVGELLSQTSGLYTRRTTEKIYEAPNFVRYALDQPLDAPPGTKWAYNNSACNLMAAVVAKAAGEPIDLYLGQRLFGPMGIEDVTWSWDDAGNRHGMSGLQIHPLDFAKLGQLMLQHGVWNGRQLLPAARVDESIRPHFPKRWDYGLLWWLIPERLHLQLDETDFAQLRADGMSQRFVDTLRALNAEGPTFEELIAQLNERVPRFEVRRLLKKERTFLQDHSRGSARIIGFAAQGYRGQYLFVDPSADLVAVRMTDDSSHTDDQVTYPTFIHDVRRLVEAGLPPSGVDVPITAPSNL